jgi:hypothetical protein
MFIFSHILLQENIASVISLYSYPNTVMSLQTLYSFLVSFRFSFYGHKFYMASDRILWIFHWYDHFSSFIIWLYHSIFRTPFSNFILFSNCSFSFISFSSSYSNPYYYSSMFHENIDIIRC